MVNVKYVLIFFEVQLICCPRIYKAISSRRRAGRPNNPPAILPTPEANRPIAPQPQSVVAITYKLESNNGVFSVVLDKTIIAIYVLPNQERESAYRIRLYSMNEAENNRF